MIPNDTIAALATPAGAGAIAVVRMSGPAAIALACEIFNPVSEKDLSRQKSHTIHLGHIVSENRTLDQVLVSLFRSPHSYTGEDVVEFSCHGSPYVQQQLLQLVLRKGARMAEAGEFTLRAFLNGKMDLSQAEAVADLIASENDASHQLAIRQMRGGFSNELKSLREELLNFASLMELELDFAEEVVEFADRSRFTELTDRIENVLKSLIDSFAVGNVLKNGIPIAIAGAPNVGKSTLLNSLLREEKAIVSEIAGTTRDSIEDEIAIGGIGFRFIDTAGIRDTSDVVEGMGIQRTYEKMEKAQVVLYMLDATLLAAGGSGFKAIDKELHLLRNKFPGKELLLLANKTDLLTPAQQKNLDTLVNELIENASFAKAIALSAKSGEGVEALKSALLNLINTGALRNNETIVTNSRHYDALLKALEAIQQVRQGMEAGVSGDLLAVDIRQVLQHIGEITGEITTDDLLGNIFANFCIGK
jgi:tRNA modification GTPase